AAEGGPRKGPPAGEVPGGSARRGRPGFRARLPAAPVEPAGAAWAVRARRRRSEGAARHRPRRGEERPKESTREPHLSRVAPRVVGLLRASGEVTIQTVEATLPALLVRVAY